MSRYELVETWNLKQTPIWPLLYICRALRTFLSSLRVSLHRRIRQQQAWLTSRGIFNISTNTYPYDLFSSQFNIVNFIYLVPPRISPALCPETNEVRERRNYCMWLDLYDFGGLDSVLVPKAHTKLWRFWSKITIIGLCSSLSLDICFCLTGSDLLSHARLLLVFSQMNPNRTERVAILWTRRSGSYLGKCYFWHFVNCLPLRHRPIYIFNR
jgi:hypothetical protein